MSLIKDKKTGRFIKNLEEINCLSCGVSFMPRVQVRKYCSRKCLYKNLSSFFKKTKIISCASCSKPLAVKPCREKMSKTGNFFCNSFCYGKWMEKTKYNVGSKSATWKGGLTKKNIIIRESARYKRWRKSVFKRDDYTCCFCGKKGGVLHSHHVKPFSSYPELRFNVSNGQTLCVTCHKQTDSYLKNKKKLCHTQ